MTRSSRVRPLPLILSPLLFTLLTLGTPAGATSTVPLTLAQQAQKAAVIVRGTLGPSSTVKEGDVTYTVYPLKVVETVAGDAAQLPQNGGQPALYFLQGVQDLPTLLPQQEAFWLLYTQKLDSPLVGFSQGFYPLNNGSISVGDLSDPAKFRAAVLAARGAK